MAHCRASISVLVFLLLVISSPLAVSGSSSARQPSPADDLRDDGGGQPPSPATIADLAWIAGDWRGEKGDGIIEEQWSTAGGGAMMGMFRWLADDEVRLYEFMLIESGPQGLLLRLKHFSPGLKGWEEKEASLEFHLTSHGNERAVFEMDPEIEQTRLVYERTADGGLEVSLLKVEDDGAESALVFNYTRH